jgi:hypothetical protein
LDRACRRVGVGGGADGGPLDAACTLIPLPVAIFATGRVVFALAT